MVDVPAEIPAGPVVLTFTPARAKPVAAEEAETDLEKYPWEAALGMFKDSKFSSEELFKERARDLLLEEVKLFGKISPEALEKAARRGVTPEELGLEDFV
jgi:hypothetical protein